MQAFELKAYRKKQFQDYVNQLPIADNLKQHIGKDRFMDENPAAYLYYPQLFYEAFHEPDTADTVLLDRLCLAGYLYYRSLIENDKMLDSDTPSYLFPVASSICQEESIKLLSSLFPLTHPFWKTWNDRKMEYLYALKTEKEHPESVSLTAYERLADGKSAFGKVAIDAVYFLSDQADTDMYAALLTSHEQFSVGFQLLDDLMDFRNDLTSPQINYAHQLLRTQLAEKEIDFTDTDPTILHKYLYLEGVAETVMNLAMNYFDKAFLLVQDQAARVPMWIALIETKRKETLLMRLQLAGYKKTLHARINLSAIAWQQPEATLTQRLQAAKAFVQRHQNADGSWHEIYNNAGLSNVWATGYILTHLSNLKTGFDTQARQHACRFLLRHRHTNGLWGYNTDWIPDTDSTTCVLLALYGNGFDVAAEFRQWLAWQKPDGGFATYPYTEEVRASLAYTVDTVEGWTQSHLCVSALALYLLAQTDPLHSQIYALEQYLWTHSSDLWEAYWWSSPVYTTTYVLRGLLQYQPTHPSVEAGIARLLEFQQADGRFTDRFDNESAFYTALVVNVLCHNPALYMVHQQAAEKAMQWLLSQQYDDGSFASSYVLQIPAPNVRHPQQVRQWKNSHTYTNILTHDFMRLFSTAAAIHAFDSYIFCTTHAHTHSHSTC